MLRFYNDGDKNKLLEFVSERTIHKYSNRPFIFKVGKVLNIYKNYFFVYELLNNSRDTIIGSSVCRKKPALSANNRYWIYGVVISPDNRGKGFGRGLMNEMLLFLKNVLKIEVINLYVFLDNQAAVLLYKSLGFVVTKEITRKNKVKLIMQKKLN